MMNGPSLIQTISQQRVVVMIGSGGVGKTTSSVALAIAAAMSGRRVALLSIDPAKRLADALGISLSHELSVVPLDNCRGSLKAAMLDQKAIFDSMVRKHAPSESIAGKILRDPLYMAASTNLAGPIEYMALARLQELVDDPQFDLVVLDTPPDSHALDFLGRPNVLSGFLEGRVVGKILKPVVFASKFGLESVINMSGKLLGGVTHITGVQALRRFGEFILLMQEVIEGFHKSGERVIEILKRPTTSFVLVTVPTRASCRSGEGLAQELKKLGYSLDGLVLNRCQPFAKDSQGYQGHVNEATRLMMQTRIKGEETIHSELIDFIQKLGGSKAVWVKKVTEKVGDLCSTAAMTAMAAELTTIET
jgi:anion-transporting  ArsA/GET3 family ATPase